MPKEGSCGLDPALCLGYIQLDRLGDLAAREVECTECGQPCEPGGVWLAVMGDLTLRGPLCNLCAETT
jgi:hypothetical protein